MENRYNGHSEHFDTSAVIMLRAFLDLNFSLIPQSISIRLVYILAFKKPKI